MTSCKPIKFFLRLGDLQVHDLQELRDQFHLDLVHELYARGVLTRWLDVHGYTDVHAALLKYQEKYQDQELDDKRANAFCNIFFPEAMPADLGDIVENFKLRAKWRAESKAMVEKKGKWQTDIEAYHKGYEELKQAIVDNAYNMPAIKARLLDMSYNYFRLFTLDSTSCLGLFEKEAPVALLLMLANHVFRNFFVADPKRWDAHVKKLGTMIPHRPGDKKLLSPFIFPAEREAAKLEAELIEAAKREAALIVAAKRGAAKREAAKIEAELIEEAKREAALIVAAEREAAEREAEEEVVSLVKATNKYTQEMWDDIEPHDNKKYMILYVSANNNVRPYHVGGGELKPEETGKFPIIKGIEYRSRNDSDYLIYMEV